MIFPGAIAPGQVVYAPPPAHYGLVAGSDQQARPRMGNVFFKTRVCNKWRNGCCPYGDRCTYAHGEHELRTLPPDLLAQLGALQLGAAHAPPPMAMPPPMQPRARANGVVMHGPPAQQGPRGHVPGGPALPLRAGPAVYGTQVVPAPPQQMYAPHFAAVGAQPSPAASASDGSSLSPRHAPDGHPFYKTRLCIRFVQMGQCSRGQHCSYAHGYEELRPRGGGNGAPHNGVWAGTPRTARPGSGSPISTTLSSSVPPQAPVSTDATPALVSESPRSEDRPAAGDPKGEEPADEEPADEAACDPADEKEEA